MISVVTQSNRAYSTLASSRKTDDADNSFGELLPAVETAEEKLMKNAPDKWVTEAGFSADAVKAAAAFMRDELGIDISKIEPTHEITPEQMDWLRSRHDFSTMRHTEMYSFKNDGGQTQYGFKSTPEYSNFLGDLMYLGIYTKQELTVGLWVEPIDTRPDSYGSVISEHLSDYLGGSLSDFSQARVSNLKNMWNFYNERSKGAFAVEGDTEFAELIKNNYLPLQRDFLDLIKKLFGNDEELLPDRGAVPVIEDASEKLKEDFGGL